MQMKDPELDILINQLETDRDMSVADFDGVAHAITFLLPDLTGASAGHLGTTDQAILIADQVYPNWSIHIRGRANDSRDSDAAIGTGRSPVLAQAILVAR
jgi:hypothetical protein